MAIQIQYEDACSLRAVVSTGSTLFTYLVGANYRRLGSESNTTNGTIAPSAGERGYGILQDRPRLADGYDIDSPTTSFINAAGGKEPWPWYKNAREAWFSGINRNVTDTNYRLCQAAGGSLTVADPIAQSFFVVGKTITLTKLDVYFKSKDSTLPVICELRKNVNGYPGPEIIPFSTTVVYPETIVVSDDASKPCTFLMNGLVHLEEGEYSIVLRSDSLKYEVWVSTINEIDVQRKVKISTQNQLGSFFKSQNLSTWTPDQLTDLKFTLYRASFDTSGIGYPTFGIHPVHFNSMALQENPLEFYPNSRNIRVLAPGHGMKNGDNVYLDAKLFTNSNFVENVSRLSGNYKVKAYDNDTFIISGVALANTTISRPTRTGGAGIQITNSHNIVYDTIYSEVPFYAPSGSNEFGVGGGQALYKVLDANTRLTEIGWLPVNREYTFDTTKVVLNPKANNYVAYYHPDALRPGLQGFDTFAISFPLVSNDTFASPLLDVKKLKINLIKTTGDNASYTASHLILEDYLAISANSVTTSIFKVNDSNILGRVLLTNASDVSNALTVTPGGYLTISAPNVLGMYRIVSTDTNNSNANIYIAKINNTSANVFAFTPNVISGARVNMIYGTKFIDELSSRNGSAKNKYITKEIKFANPSSSIFLKLDVCRPKNTNLRFFYRTKLTTDIKDITEKDFIEFPIVSMPQAADSNEFIEVETQVDNLQAFESLQIKIVFYMDEFAGRPPKVKNLRVISLA